MKINGRRICDATTGAPGIIGTNAGRSARERLELLLAKHGGGLGWRSRALLRKELRAKLDRGEALT